MKRIILFGVMGITLVIGTSLCIPVNKKTSVQTKNKQPNIVVILVDQWRGQVLGFTGKERVYTPNIDALATEGWSLHKWFPTTRFALQQELRY
ncbi:sulfatase-like hydrolase/transferase [Chitinophagaceae bacterium LB-8]|uniref:Sulfatase-like hydrolase/transferase n=1 Tax=Paraflavisolibacter caeni TaxID=2982496 RepID=A0A9X3BHT5_9BACT|nr:sulfatase-like hydrolase/transferase [Paraflavisolibacter caeni]MCU7552864.1 sulfatase-like hydrolase/transferase [Paraflavisolibacter caeni]